MHTASLVVMGYQESSGSSSATAVDFEDSTRTASRGNEEAVQLSELESGEQGLRQTASGQKKEKRRLSLSEVRKKRQAAAEENAGRREIPVAVVEQRVSNLAQGALCGSTGDAKTDHRSRAHDKAI